MLRGGRAQQTASRKPKPKPPSGGGGGGGGSAFYSQDFSGGSLPPGWSGAYLAIAGSYNRVVSSEVLAITSGKLRISTDSTTHGYSTAIYAIAGRTGGDVIRAQAAYTVSDGTTLFLRATTDAAGGSSGSVYEASGLTGSGAIDHNITIPIDGSAVYLHFFNNDEVAATVDIDDVVLTLVSAGTGGTVQPLNWLSSKYPVSFAGRTGGMQIRLSTDIPATFAKNGGANAGEFAIEDRGTAGFWLTHPTGAAGKEVIIRATSKADATVTADQTHTLGQKAAIGTSSGMFCEPFYAVWTDAYDPSTVDFTKSKWWNIFSVTPDASGDLWTTGPNSYWNYGPNRPLDIATRAIAAGSKVNLTYGGGGLWNDATKNVSASIATPAKRAALATALLAEMDRIGAVGIGLDIEKGDPFVPADWVKVHDLVKRLREARPSMYLSFPFGGTMFKGTAIGDDPSMPEYGPSIAGLCDWFDAMDYSMDQKNVDTNGNAVNKTWYSSPIRGALGVWHRLDVESLIDWYNKNGMDTRKCLLGSTLMAGYDAGATGPDQFFHPGASGWWDQHATYDNVFDYYAVNQFYDSERKASYGIVPVNKGDNITYISYERAQDWVDRAVWAQGMGLLGGILWQMANTHFPSRTYPVFVAYETLGGATASSLPNYAAGPLVTSQTFTTDGGTPAGWFGFAQTAGFGADSAALVTSGGKLVMQNRAGHTKIMADYPLTGLSPMGVPGQSGLYVVFADIVSDALSELTIRTFDDQGVQIDAEYIGPNKNLPGHMFRLWAASDYMEFQFFNETTAFSTVTIDNFIVRGPIPHISAG
jgi:hypothetical protein